MGYLASSATIDDDDVPMMNGLVHHVQGLSAYVAENVSTRRRPLRFSHRDSLPDHSFLMLDALLVRRKPEGSSALLHYCVGTAE